MFNIHALTKTNRRFQAVSSDKSGSKVKIKKTLKKKILEYKIFEAIKKSQAPLKSKYVLIYCSSHCGWPSPTEVVSPQIFSHIFWRKKSDCLNQIFRRQKNHPHRGSNFPTFLSHFLTKLPKPCSMLDQTRSFKVNKIYTFWPVFCGWKNYISVSSVWAFTWTMWLPLKSNKGKKKRDNTK